MAARNFKELRDKMSTGAKKKVAEKVETIGINIGTLHPQSVRFCQ